MAKRSLEEQAKLAIEHYIEKAGLRWTQPIKLVEIPGEPLHDTKAAYATCSGREAVFATVHTDGFICIIISIVYYERDRCHVYDSSFKFDPDRYSETQMVVMAMNKVMARKKMKQKVAKDSVVKLLGGTLPVYVTCLNNAIIEARVFLDGRIRVWIHDEIC